MSKKKPVVQTPQQRRLDDQFRQAVRANDKNAVSAALAAGADVNASYSSSQGNMLLYAIDHHDDDMVDHLLKQGIEPNCISPASNTALMRAVSMRNPALVEKLLHYNADPNYPAPVMKNGFVESMPTLYPLHQACIYGETEIAEMLVNAGADIDICAGAGGAPLWYAAANGRSEVACMLLSRGANPEASHRSTQKEYKYNDRGQRELVGRKVTHSTSGLHHPSSSGHADIIRIMLDGGADMYARDHRGETPEECAMLHNKPLRPAVLAVYEHYRQYPEFDAAQIANLSKEDLFVEREKGYRLIDSPATWRHMQEIETHLASRGEALEISDLERENKDGVSGLQRGVECFAADRVLEACLRKDGKVDVNRLVQQDGTASGLLEAMIARHQQSRLFSAKLWQNNSAAEFQAFAKALPEEQLRKMPNAQMLYLQLLEKGNKEHRDDYGRSMVNRYGKRNDSPRQIG